MHTTVHITKQIAKLPIDSMFHHAREEDITNRTARECIENIKDRVNRSIKIVDTHLGKVKEKQKAQYDKKGRGSMIEVEDKLSVNILAHREGKHKLTEQFEEEVYTVTEQFHTNYEFIK